MQPATHLAGWLLFVWGIKARCHMKDAIISVDAQKTQRTNFGRGVTLDLSAPENEYEILHFRCSQILNSDTWDTRSESSRQGFRVRRASWRVSVKADSERAKLHAHRVAR
jgi:hypothetical protein